MDNWKHRATGMRCRTCMWFVPKQDGPAPGAVQQTDGPMLPPSTPKLGRCRRNAPTMSGFPVVYLDDWCGEHKIDGARL